MKEEEAAEDDDMEEKSEHLSRLCDNGGTKAFSFGV